MLGSGYQTRRVLALASVIFPLAVSAIAQNLKPADVGTTVNGYQDDFNGTTLNANWLVNGANVYTVANGVLRVASASGDPNQLLYAAPGYDNTTQEVLLRLRILNFGTGDSVRCGAGVGVNPSANPAGGINYLLRDGSGLPEGQTGRHTAFLNDRLAWGPGFAGGFQNNVWYWIRLRQEPNASGGVNDVFAKFWLADGTAAEPASWQFTWDYTPTRGTRTGYAGITASSGGLAEFEVDYALIKASGLPGMVVNPEAFPAFQLPVAITNQPADVAAGELMPASFVVGASGFPPLTYQWYKNGAPLPGETRSTLNLPKVLLADDAAQFQVVVANVASNSNYSATSRVATLQVSADTVSPVVREIHSLGLNSVQVNFSEALLLASVTNLGAYYLASALGPPVPVLAASLDFSRTNVILQVEGLAEGQTYQLTLNGLSDQSAAHNVIAPDTLASFVALAPAWFDLEGTSPAGSMTFSNGGYNISGGGAGADEGFFAWSERAGDFDVRVRIASLDLTDPWAKAGLMARETLDSGSAFAAIFATPSISGCFFQHQFDGIMATEGAFPANYPATWLRLQRESDRFTGFVSLDGQAWTRLGQVTLSLPEMLYFGFVVSSHNTNWLATAAFRDFSTVTTNAPLLPTSAEPVGPASRRTSLVISEIMYHPAPQTLTNSLEFIELCNTRAEPEDLGGFRLSGDIDFTFPPGTVIPGGGFLVVARSPADVQQVYGIKGVMGPFANNLPNNSGTIRLRHRTGAVFLEVKYDSKPPWPAAADGAGHSLVLKRPSYGHSSPMAWAASNQMGGSPGQADPVTSDPLDAVVINEFLARSGGMIGHDFIELYNRGNQDLDLTGCVITDSHDTNQFPIPDSTIIRARDFLVIPQTTLGYSLDGSGSTIFLRRSANGRVLDAIRYSAQSAEISFGRTPDGGPVFNEMSAKTPGAANAPPLNRDVVINEIMYAPISGDDNDQYVELHNQGTNTIDISNWRFVDGISFQFPANTFLGPKAYIVVAKNLAHLLAKYPNLNATNAVGDFAGSLAGRGERIALALFEAALASNHLAASSLRSLAPPPEGGNTGNVIIDPAYNPDAYVVVDEVTYGTGGRWGRWSAGGGSSLELTDPRSDNRLAPNWADSDETTKAPWTLINFTGTLDWGNVTADSLQIVLLGAGECLVDDVRVLNSSGQNVIANSTFDSNMSGWTAEGTMSASYWEPPAVTNSGCLHIRAVDRGDNQVNRVRTTLTSALTAGTTATIQARVRWLKGHPEIVFRVRGNWLEAVARLNLPPNLGTPAAPNSRLTPNAPPAIYEVAHFPVLPAAQEGVRVTARVDDPDGVADLTLYYRIDPASTFSALPMNDAGVTGDLTAGDGVFTAMIPGQNAGALVAFYLQAADNHPQPVASGFPADAPARECLVRFGETMPYGNLPAYRLWMTQTTFNNWAGRNKLNNTPNDVTFVLGGHRVIYNAEALFAGSPYIAPGFSTPSGNRCGYSITLPPDDRLFGDTDLVLDWPGGHGSESTGIQEQMAYWIADRMGLPFSHRHFIRLYVNGVADMQRGGVFEAVMQPGGDYLDQWAPQESKGEFYKIDRGFEFSDAGSLVADPMPRLQLYATGGQKKTARYRWTWLKRSYDSALNFTNLFDLVDALNALSPEPYTAWTEKLVDVEQWMGVFAFEHIINNFDSWGHDIGKNMYTFKPRGGKWVLYPFDLDWLMLVSPNGPGGYSATTGPLFASEDPTVTKMYNHPPFRRAYLRAIQRAVDNPLLNANADAVMDAKYRTLVNNGVTLCDGQALTGPSQVKTWFAQRRGYLQAQLNAVAAPFAVAGTTFTVTSNVVTLSGTAPVTVSGITINGELWPPTWTTVTNWTLHVPVAAATNSLMVVGVDTDGHTVGAAQTVTVTYSGQIPPPQGLLVINEIMYHPAVPGAEYVELFNASQNYTFALNDWRINGLDYRFPAGSLLEPNHTLVLAKDPEAFAAAYGRSLPLFGVYAGNLQSDGETLSLLKPGPAPGTEEIVDQVRYEPNLPWPAAANGAGAALQLLDPRRDRRRVVNWSDGATWRFIAFTVTNVLTLSRTNLEIQPKSAGEIYLDDLRVEAGSVLGGGTNLVINGDFENPLAGTWNLGTNVLESSLSTAYHRSGQTSLHLVAANRATSPSSDCWQVLKLNDNTVYTVSFWYLPSASLSNVEVFITSFVRTNVTVFSANQALSPFANNPVAAALPDLPPVWLNEVQPENLSGPTNSLGEHAAWIELYNGSTNTISLQGWFLANNYSNLTQWAFPTGAVIEPGQFAKVWADGHPELSNSTDWHTSLALNPGAGAVALAMPVWGAPAVLDYLNYTNLPPDDAYGDYPDGQPFYRRNFHFVTPGASNNPAWPSLPVVINEWMADNSTDLQDPIDQNFEDWFELYNNGDAVADLSGYYLTDNLTNRFQFKIPTGWTIPPGGFLLIWADNEFDQNQVGGTNLHVNFALNKNGEAIGLFAPDGTLVDAVVFDAQSPNQTQGRYPDGSADIYTLPQSTPAAPNAEPQISNERPVIVPIGPQSVLIGQTLILTFVASDADLPPQDLTFTLGLSTPPGMTISSTGNLTWTPAVGAPASNRVQVIVSDNGTPPLSASTYMIVLVGAPPQFTPGQWQISGNTFSFRYTTLPGKTYQVEYSDRLNNPTWLPLGDAVTADAATLLVQDALTRQRFYRVKVLSGP